MSGHSNCCKGRKVPKTRAQFMALNYPSNYDAKDDVYNRLHNPNENELVRYKPRPGYPKDPVTKKSRKGWWFPLQQVMPGPPLLDGSGDGQPRGFIVKSNGVVPKNANSRLVCLNACNLKIMPVPVGGGKTELRQCGFTWNVKLEGQSGAFSGWMPIAAIKFKNKTAKERALNTLRDWTCCIEKYETWGKALTRPQPMKYVFRSNEELEGELALLATNPAKFKDYFRDNTQNRVKKLLALVAKADKKRDKLNELIGITPHCGTANKLTDYLPKGSDAKLGGGDKGYTNLSANISTSATRTLMAPIGVDLLPAGHTFHRLRFKDGRAVLGFIYRVPPSKKGAGARIGRVVWYYGYVDLVEGDKDKKQRRYGWVPALAVRRP